MSTRSRLEFLRTETGAGVLLAVSALIAVAWANSPLSPSYHALVQHPFTIRIGGFDETLSVQAWVRDGLMAIFFFVVGLEIKHEALRGELANPRRLALPILAAAAGALAPALIYGAATAASTIPPQGWATPAATDMSVALAALALAGSRLPPSLRVFLLTVAIVADLIAVALIAIFYSDGLRPVMLAGAGFALLLLAAMSRWRQAPHTFYAAAFALLWAFTLKSGVSTALAGMAAALIVPVEPLRPGQRDLSRDLMAALHPYVAYLILPLFAFTAAGFTLGKAEPLIGPLSIGLAVALFVGKPAAVFAVAAALIGLKWARKPTGARWVELAGVAFLCGAGFTMSLYVGDLAFRGEPLVQSQMRAGVIAGSLASLAVGMGLLAWSQARRGREG